MGVGRGPRTVKQTCGPLVLAEPTLPAGNAGRCAERGLHGGRRAPRAPAAPAEPPAAPATGTLSHPARTTMRRPAPGSSWPTGPSPGGPVSPCISPHAAGADAVRARALADIATALTAVAIWSSFVARARPSATDRQTRLMFPWRVCVQCHRNSDRPRPPDRPCARERRPRPVEASWRTSCSRWPLSGWTAAGPAPRGSACRRRRQRPRRRPPARHEPP